MRYLLIGLLFSSVAYGQAVQSLKRKADGSVEARFKNGSVSEMFSDSTTHIPTMQFGQEGTPARTVVIQQEVGGSGRLLRIADDDNNPRFDFSVETANYLRINNGTSDAPLIALHTGGAVLMGYSNTDLPASPPTGSGLVIDSAGVSMATTSVETNTFVVGNAGTTDNGFQVIATSSSTSANRPLTLLAQGRNADNSGDMVFDVRQYDGSTTPFSDLGADAYRWRTSAATTMALSRNGILQTYPSPPTVSASDGTTTLSGITFPINWMSWRINQDVPATTGWNISIEIPYTNGGAQISGHLYCTTIDFGGGASSGNGTYLASIQGGQSGLNASIDVIHDTVTTDVKFTTSIDEGVPRVLTFTSTGAGTGTNGNIDCTLQYMGYRI